MPVIEPWIEHVHYAVHRDSLLTDSLPHGQGLNERGEKVRSYHAWKRSDSRHSEDSLTGNAFRQLGGNLLEEGTGV
jgi:hypothetical protein